MEVSLRKVRADDYEFLWRLKTESLRSYIEQTWGWDEAWQRTDFAERFDPEVGQIIIVDGSDAGYWSVDERTDEILLVSIHLLPEFQNRGIGSGLITELVTSSPRP